MLGTMLLATHNNNNIINTISNYVPKVPSLLWLLLAVTLDMLPNNLCEPEFSYLV